MLTTLSDKLWFPHPNKANADGLLAIGGDLSISRLLLAYNSGVFPWYDETQPLLWWSPDPRMVLYPRKFKVSKSLRKTLRSEKFKISVNQNFKEVIENCASIKRKGQHGTWITSEMIKAYIELHEAGKALSVEVWDGSKLVGGLYGVDLPEKRVFCGESMFSLVSDASKVAFYYLSKCVQDLDYKLIDCQVYNPHLESLGAEKIDRSTFLEIISI
ncbi:MAG TPA: leucyl/phenylalanyl-tRNA--protein transferase [Aequorivita sp.]|nr:leucyl/phenylalanyl-tRNA--protein transferase [Aequorivita sp.]